MSKVSEDPKPRTTFASLGKAVLRTKAGQKVNEVVAHCISNTYARRIAHALNLFQPNKRGY